MVPSGGVAPSKLLQARVYGARVLEIDAHFEGVLDVAQAAADTPTVALVNSVNPYRIEGQATGAYEIVDVIGRLYFSDRRIRKAIKAVSTKISLHPFGDLEEIGAAYRVLYSCDPVSGAELAVSDEIQRRRTGSRDFAC